MDKISPCLWFDANAEQAVAFYFCVFPESRILETSRYPESEHPAHEGRAGTVLTISFTLLGQPYTALNPNTEDRSASGGAMLGSTRLWSSMRLHQRDAVKELQSLMLPMIAAKKALPTSVFGLNGGSQFKINGAVSFQVMCDTQQEVDHYGSKLTA